MPPASPTITLMISAARKAARALRRDFGEVENLQVSRKGPADFVSAADQRAEDIIREELHAGRRGYGFLLEESGEIAGTDKSHRWIVDPLDGTLNFLHGMPHFAISIGLEREGAVVAGVVYNPIVDELFWAEKGRGAYLNDRRMRVSSRQGLADAVIATGIPFRGRAGHAQFLTELHAVMGEVAGVRRFGSAALDLAWVAAGRFDGFWERGLNAWDIAAGVVLVREAGGVVRGLGGGDPLASGDIVAATESVMDPLTERLATTRA
ncbi:MAG: inositol monophosphatase [Caulobacterales bacterium]|nr:inositol monophosphatase [Caulobacterales bacterium]